MRLYKDSERCAVVTESSKISLIREMDEMIKDGWIPIGSIKEGPPGQGGECSQTMWRPAVKTEHGGTLCELVCCACIIWLLIAVLLKVAATRDNKIHLLQGLARDRAVQVGIALNDPREIEAAQRWYRNATNTP